MVGRMAKIMQREMNVRSAGRAFLVMWINADLRL